MLRTAAADLRILDAPMAIEAARMGRHVLVEKPMAFSTAEAGAMVDAADQAGGSQEAFLAYLRAFQALPEPPASADDRRLRPRADDP